MTGTAELAHRMSAFQESFKGYERMAVHHKADDGVVKALYNIRLIFTSILKFLHDAAPKSSAVRSGAAYVSQIKLFLDDLQLSNTKLGHAVYQAYESNETSNKLNKSRPGQEECLKGDKAYFGHGIPRSFAMALLHYRESAKLGYGPAMNSLATMLREGKGAPRDLPSAISWYKRAAAVNNLDAINNLGQMYEGGEGVGKSLQMAIEKYQQAANGGHADAQTNLGYIYEHGSEDSQNYVATDLKTAALWYREAANSGYAKAQNNLGYLYFIGAVSGEPDFAEAIKWFTKASEQGNAGSQNNLGICLESGQGIRLSEQKAEYFYKLAADQGHPSAQASLGYLYLKRGKFTAAIELLRKSAEQSCKEAFYHLGQVYHHGIHVQKDINVAFTFYGRASEHGHPYGLLELGHCLFAGRGCDKNITKAYTMYKKAAELGVSEAENALGIMLEEGVGSEKNVTQAMYWYRRAAHKGNADALFNIGLLLESGNGVAKNLNAAKQAYEQAAKMNSTQAKVRLTQLAAAVAATTATQSVGAAVVGAQA
jgi:TPR repeat protein